MKSRLGWGWGGCLYLLVAVVGCGDDAPPAFPMVDGGNLLPDGSADDAGDASSPPDAARDGSADAATPDGSAGNDGGNDASTDDDSGTGSDGAITNTAPIAADDSATTNEDVSIDVDVLANDSDADGDALTITITVGPVHGTATVETTGVRYVPEPNYRGGDELTYQISDGHGGTATATVTFLVTSIDDAPVGLADTYSVLEEGALVVDAANGVLGNDMDAEGDALTATVVDDVQHGTLMLFGDGAFLYTPTADYSGADSFRYIATANGANSANVIVTLTVAAVNDVPSFTKGGDFTVAEDAGPQAALAWATTLSAGPANEATQTLSFEVMTNNSALFGVQPVVSPSGGLSFTPAANANGIATVTVAIVDSGGTTNSGVDRSATQTFTIEVLAINDAPTFAIGADQSVFEDVGARTITSFLTSPAPGPSDEASQQITLSVQNDNGSLFAVAPAIAQNGTLTYAPAANANGVATVTLTLVDDGGTASGGVDTTTQSFTITVSAVNDAPSFVKGAAITVLEDAAAQTLTGWATALSVGPADESAQTLSFTVTTNNNSLFSVAPALSGDGTLTFTPAANANGAATLTITANDSGGASSAAQTVLLTVTAVNDAPSFVVGPDRTCAEDTGPFTTAPWITAISAGPADEVAQTVSFQLTVDNPSLFSVGPIVSNSGSLTWRPAPNQNGVATIQIRASDTGGTANGGVAASATQTFTITITAVPDAPVANDDTAVTVYETPIQIAVLANDTDGDGDVLSITGNTDPSNGIVTRSSTSVTYTPNLAWSGGTDTFTVTISDGNGGSDTSTVTVTVTPDTAGPALVSSIPAANDALTQQEAFGTNGQLLPARFLFNDMLLVGANVTATITRDGVTLTGGVDYTLNSSVPGMIAIGFVPNALSNTTQDGDAIRIRLSNIADSHGNAGANVDVSFLFDDQAPLTQELSFGPSQDLRCIFQWPEPMATTSGAGFAIMDTTTNTPLLVEPNASGYRGSGFASLDVANDTYFWVPRDLVRPGQNVTYNASSFADLAGNAATGPEVSGSATPGGFGPSDFDLLAVRFVESGTTVLIDEVPASVIRNRGLLVPNTVTDSDADMLLIFDRALSNNYSAQLSVESRPNGTIANATQETTTATGDTLRLDPTSIDTTFTWGGALELSLRYEVRDTNNQSGLYDELDVVVQQAGSDGVAPTVSAVSARRGTGQKPIVRRGEPLRVSFSEAVDPRTLSSSAFTIRNTTTQAVTPAFVARRNEIGAMVVFVRGSGAAGEPILLPVGEYELTVAAVDDTSDPPLSVASVAIPFEVRALGTTAATLVDTSPTDGDDRVNVDAAIHLGFTDTIDAGSAIDVGPASTRGIRFEEEFYGGLGAVFIPRKGFHAERSDTGEEGEILRVRGLWRSMSFGTNQRITTLPGLTNIDGIAISGTLRTVFATHAQVTTSRRPAFDWFELDAQVLHNGPFTLGGQPVASALNARAMLRDSDGAPWSMTVTNLDTNDAFSSATFPQPNMSLTITGTDFDSFLPAGVESEIELLAEDSTATPLTCQITERLYRVASATLDDAEPVVTDLGGGRFQIDGDVPAGDAARVLQITVFLSVVDSAQPGVSILQIAYSNSAQLTRNPDGSLSYSHTMATDRALPILPGTLRYRAAAMIFVANPRAIAGADGRAISPNASAFNAAL